MKKLYIAGLIIGGLLLLATESSFALSNVIGLAVFSLSAYKLGLFNEHEYK